MWSSIMRMKIIDNAENFYYMNSSNICPQTGSDKWNSSIVYKYNCKSNVSVAHLYHQIDLVYHNCIKCQSQ